MDIDCVQSDRTRDKSIDAAPTVTFANSAAYTSYRLIFPTIRNPAAANSMQISEVAFLERRPGQDVTHLPASF
jgi:hypothetical protein